jgi:hypothetical protein
MGGNGQNPKVCVAEAYSAIATQEPQKRRTLSRAEFKRWHASGQVFVA